MPWWFLVRIMSVKKPECQKFVFPCTHILLYICSISGDALASTACVERRALPKTSATILNSKIPGISTAWVGLSFGFPQQNHAISNVRGAVKSSSTNLSPLYKSFESL